MHKNGTRIKFVVSYAGTNVSEVQPKVFVVGTKEYNKKLRGLSAGANGVKNFWMITIPRPTNVRSFRGEGTFRRPKSRVAVAA
jgi:hypothetical protein